MKKTGGRKLSHEKLTEHIRNGAMYPPETPGLKEAVREVLRPMLEVLEGREILYDQHVLCLARVESVKVSKVGFRVVSTRIKYIDTNRGLMFASGHEPPGLIEFGGCWEFWSVYRSGFKPQMCCDICFPDQKLVAAVKAAVEQGVAPKDILALVFPKETPTKGAK